jgi:hypothetical protein
MSVRRSTIGYGVAAGALALVIVAGSLLYLGLPNETGINSLAGPPSLLVIQLTDPPVVPAGTSSLNLSYSSLSLLVGEPSGIGRQIVLKTVTVTPPGGSVSMDLLKLQNVSQTIGTASLPDGSSIYSVTFDVSGIRVAINGTIFPVTLASGGGNFEVTLANNPILHGTNLALLRLDPVVVNTPSGYELIPSSVGVIRATEGGGEGQLGFQHHLSNEDNRDLNELHGSISASLLELSVAGNTTTIEIQVNNTGLVPLNLNAVGIDGNFQVQNSNCGGGNSQSGEDHGNHGNNGGKCAHDGEIVFVPLMSATTTSITESTTTTSSRTCSTFQLRLGSADGGPDDWTGLSLEPGQCAYLSYNGVISFGESNSVYIPSTSMGQIYEIHIAVSNGAGSQLTCTLPPGVGSCKLDHHES